MISKMWQSIQEWTKSLTHKKPQPIAVMKMEKPSHTRFLVESRSKSRSKSRMIEKNEQQQNVCMNEIPKNQQELQTLYRLICEEEIKKNKSQINLEEGIQNQEFLCELQKIQKSIKNINLNNNQVLDDRPIRRMQYITNQMKRVNNCGKQEGELYLQYKKQILTVLQGKYREQIINDCPEITFQQFKMVKSIWKQTGRQVERVVPGCLHLKVKDLQLLENRKWLNDEIISEYVSLLKQKFQSQDNAYHFQNFRILNSLQVASFFDKKKYDKNKVFKFFQRQKITKTSTIIMTVHKVNHWIFVKINKNCFQVYDSIYRSNVEEYLRFPTLANIYEFTKQFYEEELMIKSVSDFPQQNNDYDCGMMMLSGIKDIVKQNIKWSFHQSQMPYRRFLVAKELIDHKIVGY